MIQGRDALESEFPATVLTDVCTAAKVGPRQFLLAAHCVHLGGGVLRYRPGDKLMVNEHNDSRVPGRRFTVREVIIDPVYFDSAKDPDLPDVAMITVEEESPNIPEAALDAKTVGPGEQVVITGYGCTGEEYYVPRLKIQQVPTLGKEMLMHPGGFEGRPDLAAIVAANDVITPGISLFASSASICPGDSGGPLYRAGSKDQLVVGVNSYYSFMPGKPYSATNWHARVDAAARYPVLTRMQSAGANVRTTGTCSDRVQNAPETGVDCGASCGSTCANGSSCRSISDCASLNCVDGTCRPSPCAGICSNPTTLGALPYSLNPVGTGSRCIETTAPLKGVRCGSMGARTRRINDEPWNCDDKTPPATRNGGYCFQVGDGAPANAWVTTW